MEVQWRGGQALAKCWNEEYQEECVKLLPWNDSLLILLFHSYE